MLYLLQTPALADSTGMATETGSSKSMMDILIAGGWPMIPLFILLVLAIFIYIERMRTIRQADGDSNELMQRVRDYVLNGNIEGAKALCDTNASPFARMIRKGLGRLGSPLKDIQASIENVGELEVYRLERRLSILATIAGAAPMIGFFGTVLGMIKAFNAIVTAGGQTDAIQLADGISEALITTASGLVVGIIAYLAYNSLVAMKDKVVYKLELTSAGFVDLLQEPAG